MHSLIDHAAKSASATKALFSSHFSPSGVLIAPPVDTVAGFSEFAR
jgi:hypothetical protein